MVDSQVMLVVSTETPLKTVELNYLKSLIGAYTVYVRKTPEMQTFAMGYIEGLRRTGRIAGVYVTTCHVLPTVPPFSVCLVVHDRVGKTLDWDQVERSAEELKAKLCDISDIIMLEVAK